MKFGVREICDVVLKAKANQKIGNKIFYKNEPVIYFDTLKTSSMEGAATTVYAQGGRGNSRLVAWEGERTITFTMEDALISPAGFMILSGAGLVEAGDPTEGGKSIKVHTTEQTDKFKVTEDGTVEIVLSDAPYFDEAEDFIYVMTLQNGEVVSEPFIPVEVKAGENDGGKKKTLVIKASGENVAKDGIRGNYTPDLTAFSKDKADAVLVDYYVERTRGAQEITITADKFGGNYYLEASTLFRTQDGVDMPAEFIIPNCKIQSNFTFTMASSGDPSTFTFTMDAFPDYTRFDKSKKVLAVIQVISDSDDAEDIYRIATTSEDEEDSNGIIYRPASKAAIGE